MSCLPKMTHRGHCKWGRSQPEFLPQTQQAASGQQWLQLAQLRRLSTAALAPAPCALPHTYQQRQVVTLHDMSLCIQAVHVRKRPCEGSRALYANFHYEKSTTSSLFSLYLWHCQVYCLSRHYVVRELDVSWDFDTPQDS